MEKLIPIVNQLQDVFGAVGHQFIDLPQITVVGSQSAGKSSVLETIVGRDFLPRGNGIVTRRPLVLQLYSIDSSDSPESPQRGSSKGEEWGEFFHLPGQKFFDFSEIRAEIQRETDRVTGRNKGISNKTINLRIYSPHVLNLTLVDLPGITKVPTGDQPADVEEQILSMCYEFISNPNAIILAVSAANQDIANSEGIKLARAVDPDGERTIGVLTKVDIMDHGTDCLDILSNKVIPLRKGYIAVMNRSQKDIQDNLSIRKGLEKEKAFFLAHPRYREVAGTKCGTPNLARNLNQLLMHHIRDCLPDIRSRINSMLSGVQRDLSALGECVDDLSTSAKGAILLRTVSQFATNFSNQIEGLGTPHKRISGTYSAASSTLPAFGSVADDHDMTELYGGARINYIFNEVYGKKIKNLDPCDGLTEEDIRTAIANAKGVRPSLFVPEVSFDLLVRKQITRLEHPGMQCVELVMDEVQKMVEQSETAELQRFPDLRDQAMEIVHQLLRNCLKPAQKMISDLIQIEKAYINTSHPDFIGGKAAIITAQNSRKTASAHQSANGSSSSHANGNNSSIGPPIGSPGLVRGAQKGGELPQHPGNGAGNGASSPPPLGATPPPAGAGGETKGFMQLFQSPTASAKQQQLQQQQQLLQQQQLSTPANLPLGESVAVSARRGSQHRGGGGERGADRGLGASSSSSSFHNGSRIVRLSDVPEHMRVDVTPTDIDRIEAEIIKTLIISYYNIVKKNFLDMVPKATMHFLINNFKENLQNELVSKLYNEHFITTMMREGDEVAAKRKAFREMEALLRRGLEIVVEARDFQV